MLEHMVGRAGKNHLHADEATRMSYSILAEESEGFY